MKKGTGMKRREQGGTYAALVHRIPCSCYNLQVGAKVTISLWLELVSKDCDYYYGVRALE
jgi:hypothetical protein